MAARVTPVRAVRIRRTVASAAMSTSNHPAEPEDDPVPRRSAINLDSVESVSLAILVDRLGRLSDARMRQVCRALAIAVDCTN
jgi:mRNA interferase MazF